nr:SDR family NAD(P)-dependent oxidoreductase [Rhodococcus sp. (in: high G+C Gram-positive bacteria)]
MTNSESTHPPVLRTWFITGATSGIGLATATAALGRGDNVVATGRSISTLDSLAAQYPDSLLVAVADVRDETALHEAVDRAVHAFGRIDVLATNAAFGIFGGIEEISGEQWRNIFETNFFGTMNALRAVLPVMRKQQSGHVLLASAHYGQSSHSGVGSVAATKHALEGITDSLVEEVAPLGIKVTSFAPGFTATEFLARLDMGENGNTDYDQTVRATYQAVGAMPAEAFNSAEAVAAALLTVVDSEKPPRRLATGNTSYTLIKDSLDARLAELTEWSAVTKNVETYAG